MDVLNVEAGRYVYIETFGCLMNENDTSRMMGLLKEMEFTATDSPYAADLIIINTCSVRDKAEQKLYSILGRFRELKQEKPGLIIGVAGCVAQQSGSAIFKRAPYVDIVFGTHNVHRLKELLTDSFRPKRRVVATEFRPSIDLDEYAHNEVASNGKAFVAVMRGCDNFCSYCIVPYTRGREVSRKSSDILAEIEKLVKSGVKEITLVGQNVNSYGQTSGADVSFPALLRMASQAEGVKRVRFMTSHPKDISDELIEIFHETPVLCRHLHLPVQSGSDNILKLMRRGYTVAEYLAKAARIRAQYRDVALTSDIIAGFPGETDADFEATLELIREIRFDNCFAFMYSPRPGTDAALYQGQVPASVKASRLQRLFDMQREITEERNLTLKGSAQMVLVEGRSNKSGGESDLFGRTSCGRIVHFHASDEKLIGSEVTVQIKTTHRNSLRGELVAQTLRQYLA